MHSDYLVVIFKNKDRYKIIKKYLKYKNALNFYNKEVKLSNDVIFNIETENGKKVKYEIGLLEKTSEKLIPIYKTDEIGRNITIQLDDPNYGILKIDDYRFPEKIQNIKTKKRIDIDELIKKYLKGDSMKMVSKLNNKIVVQDNDVFNIFSCKSSDDAERLLNSLQKHFMEIKKKNCLIVFDSSSAQKKYLYEVLSEKGFDKNMLYRTSTTHPKDK
jgi:hypothetical protein